MKPLNWIVVAVTILCGSGPPVQAGPLFTYSALIDGMGSITIPGSAAPGTDHFDIVADPGPSGPFDAGGIGADIRITTTMGVSMTSFQNAGINVISNDPHTFTVTIHDLNNGLSGTFTAPFTLSAMYNEGTGTSSTPTHSFTPSSFTIGLDTFMISEPASGWYTGPSAPPQTGGTSPVPGAFLVHVTGVTGTPPVPEPSSLALFTLGLLGLLVYRLRPGRRSVSVP